VKPLIFGTARRLHVLYVAVQLRFPATELIPPDTEGGA